MEPFRYHVFVCDQQKPEGIPCCSARGSAQVLETLRREISARGLDDEVQVTTCGSLGLCEQGPNMVVYPEATWYSGVTAADVPEIVKSHFQEHRPVARLVQADAAVLRAAMLQGREKRMAAQRAREAAGAVPDEWNDRIRAFQESRAILTGLELDVFSALAAGGTAAETAAKLQTHPRATGMLLNALTAIGLLVKHDGRFTNSPVAARYFTMASPDSARMAMLHTANLWARWSTLTDAVRAGTAVMDREAAGRDGDWTEAFIAAMHRNAALRCGPVVRAVGAGEVRRMLDVGGGSGAYSIAFARANPELHADILDLPAVAAIAQRHIDQAGVADRVRVRVGDLRNDALGQGYDLVFVSAICHMLSPEENAGLLKRAHAALDPGGRIVIQDFVLTPDKTAPKWAALFSLNMLVGTRAGSSYSEPEYRAWLVEAGFGDARNVCLPGPAGLVIASR